MQLANTEKRFSLGKIAAKGGITPENWVCKIGALDLYCYAYENHDEDKTDSGWWFELVQHVEGKKAQRAMFLTLRNHRENMFAVEMVRVDSKYQGFGLANKVYKKLMDDFGISLITDEYQTPGGQHIWFKMFETKGVQIHAIKGNGKRTPRVLHEVRQDDVFSRLQVEGADAWSEAETNQWAFVACSTKGIR
jgi:hypothetical protein